MGRGDEIKEWKKRQVEWKHSRADEKNGEEERRR